MVSDILTVEEAVVLLKISKPTFYRWLGEGRLKGFKVGREWRFYRRDLLGHAEASDAHAEGIKRELRQAVAWFSRRLKDKGVIEPEADHERVVHPRR